jgi:glycosyltransferase involved in cell wall biosynthesis
MRCSSVQLSVALVTCNRPDSLERGLASLRSQGVQPFEVIVSDDSGREHAERVRALAAKYGGIYCVGPHRGLYANRNFAAEQCRGSHVRTMDDDHIFPPNHLALCFDAVNRDRNAVWTTGEIGYLTGERSRVADNPDQLGPAGVGEAIKDIDDNWGIADGSTIYPRQVFDRGLRMVEDFCFGSSYLEFGAYLYRNGWKCRCVPGALVEHYAAFLRQPDPMSIVFASVCFNAHFRPNIMRLTRHLVPHWRQLHALPHLFQKAKLRWSVP